MPRLSHALQNSWTESKHGAWIGTLARPITLILREPTRFISLNSEATGDLLAKRREGVEDGLPRLRIALHL